MAQKRSSGRGKISTDGHKAVLKRVKVAAKKAKKAKKAAKKKK